ncbi:MAG: phage tail protein [Cyanobacteria bacterium J06635_1]
MLDKILQPSIRDERNEAYEAVLQRLQALNLAVLDIYDIDNVDSSALFDLADQFNVLGLRGWNLAETEAQRRDLIKEAIQLHQTAGTPYAIKRAMTLVGYPNATIRENPGTFYDGEWVYDGTRTYNGAQLGEFEVTLDPIESRVSGPLITLIVALINEWKNARSKLFDLRIGNISLFSNLLQYDNLWFYNGLQEYDGERNL